MREISSDKVCFLIIKLRQFQAKEAPVIPDPGDNVTDDADREVLFDLPDDATEEEVRAFFEQLNEDETVELLAMLWLGSGNLRGLERGGRRRQAGFGQPPGRYVPLDPARGGLPGGRSDAIRLFLRGCGCATPVDIAVRMIRVGIGGWTYEPWRGTFLSRRPAAVSPAELREPAARHDRDQRHLLPHAEAGQLSTLGGGKSGRLCFLG